MGQSAYDRLEQTFEKMSHIHHLLEIAGWDEAVMMPPGGGEARGHALATGRAMVTEMMHAPELQELLDQAEEEVSTDQLWQQANLREMRRHWEHANAVSLDLVAATSRAASRCEQAWRSKRAENDWEGMRPLLEEVVQLQREEAQQRSEKSGLSPYDSLIELYEPGQNTESLNLLFAELKAFLPDFIKGVVEHQRTESVHIPDAPYTMAQQEALGRDIMAAVGFDFQRGRLDVSHHPFCGGVPQDVRLTTRYTDGHFVESLMGVIHETGHARYEQQLPREWIHQPVGRARSMGVHESQSLLFEMQMGRSRDFLTFALPIMKKHFGENLEWSEEQLHRLYTRVKPDYIRVNADEVTYPLHVILRFELEQQLIGGSLEVADLPEAWNTKMEESFGLSTKNNYKDGCLQDVHWMAGIFGYFPSYTLGAMLASQLFDAAKKANAAIPGQIRKGDFSGISAWLQEKIWGLGSFYMTPDLIQQATGESLNSSHFLSHLKRRYQEEAGVPLTQS